MEEMIKRTARRIKQIRTEKHMSQKEFAAALGDDFSQVIISRCEKEDAKFLPDVDRLVKIADFGEVSLDWLVGRTNDRGGATPEIDKIGLDHESISILEDMTDLAEREGTDGAICLNLVIQSPHFREFLSSLDNLDYIAEEYAMHFNQRGQRQAKRNREESGIVIEDSEDLQWRLEDIARRWGYFVSVTTDPATVIQIKTEAVATAARKVANDIAEHWTKDYFEFLKKIEAEQRKAAPKEEKGE
ncbi:MAG: helix-turn-helix domain-containing protein [Clostridiales bacterium]|nr:helix-turn-helix domain-containing protein [Clostridiales bacterium]MCC8099758.1 helix-turn-helix domain-containing protein [Clostridiales bacterium]